MTKAQGETEPGAPHGGALSRDELLAAPPAARSALILALLRRQSARILELPPARLRVDRSLAAHGLDSLAAAELAGAIETNLGVRVDLASLLEGPTLAELGKQVLGLLEEPEPAAAGEGGGQEDARKGQAAVPSWEPAAAPPPTAAPPPNRFPLSHGQRALWLLDRLVPGGNPAYVIAGAARIRDQAGSRTSRADLRHSPAASPVRPPDAALRAPAHTPSTPPD